MADVIAPIPTKLTLEIVTPDRALVKEQVDEVVVPAAEGSMGILPGHTPLLASLHVGEVTYRQGKDVTHLHVSFGFVEVLPDHVTVLARIAERAEEIDVPRAEAARKRAEEHLSRTGEPIDFERARISLMKSLIRLQVASRIRQGIGGRG